jgi:hypothetical protein
MGGTIGFTDNVPHGTVMQLRVPQQHPQCQQQQARSCKLDSTMSTRTDSTCTDGVRTDSTSSSSGSSSRTDRKTSSNSNGSNSNSVERNAATAATAASNDHALSSKRILVSTTNATLDAIAMLIGLHAFLYSLSCCCGELC